MPADVRAGKYLEIKLDSQERSVAEAKVEEMCDKLLANPVIESYRYEVEEVDGIALRPLVFSELALKPYSRNSCLLLPTSLPCKETFA